MKLRFGASELEFVCWFSPWEFLFLTLASVSGEIPALLNVDLVLSCCLVAARAETWCCCCLIRRRKDTWLYGVKKACWSVSDRRVLVYSTSDNESDKDGFRVDMV